jgi:hypothetical protein
MIGTKVVDTTQDIHASLQGLRLLNQRSGSPSQSSQSLPKGGIEPLNESGVNTALALTGLDQSFNQVSTALNNPSLNGQAASGSLFDHLDDGDVRPRTQVAATRLTQPRHFSAKSALKSFDIAGQAIHSQQQWPTQGDDANLVSQRLDQAFVTVGADDPAQPQAGRDHHRQGHPHRTSLSFDFDLVSLDLLQIELAVSYSLIVDFLAMLTGSLPPAFDCPLIKPIGGHNCLQGTAMRQQRQHDQHQLHICFEPIKNRAAARRKGRPADFTLIPLLLLAMDADVASSDLSSCRTIKIRAKYLLWVHRSHSWLWSRNLPVCPVNSLFSNFYPLSSKHALFRCYQRLF